MLFECQERGEHRRPRIEQDALAKSDNFFLEIYLIRHYLEMYYVKLD
jgi:hypothetical protein